MSKFKKVLIAPIVIHVVLLGVLVFFALNRDPSLRVVTPLLFDWMLGAFVTPMFFALMGIIHAIVHEGKVYDYLYQSLGYLAIIGVMRFIAYSFADGFSATTIMTAGTVLVIGIGVYVLWAALFSLTDHLMKKRPKKKGVNRNAKNRK